MIRNDHVLSIAIAIEYSSLIPNISQGIIFNCFDLSSIFPAIKRSRKDICFHGIPPFNWNYENFYIISSQNLCMAKPDLSKALCPFTNSNMCMKEKCKFWENECLIKESLMKYLKQA